MVFYYQEKEGSGQPTFILKLADQDLLLFPKSKIFYIVDYKLPT